MANSIFEYPPIEAVATPNVTTDQAAFYLNRRPQTLRKWAAYENGPILPVRINGYLAWPVSKLKEITTSGDAA